MNSGKRLLLMGTELVKVLGARPRREIMMLIISSHNLDNTFKPRSSYMTKSPKWLSQVRISLVSAKGKHSNLEDRLLLL